MSKNYDAAAAADAEATKRALSASTAAAKASAAAIDAAVAEAAAQAAYAQAEAEAEAARKAAIAAAQKKYSAIYGPDNVWTTEELQDDFVVEGFMAPFCVVKRKSDGARGSVQFDHSPRIYYNFRKA